MGEVVVSSEECMEVELGPEVDTEIKRNRTTEAENEDGSSEVVRWESFLPKMVLRVLLVEADDSTRQIIAALLRKCSYRVSAVPDGLMAWETLKSRPHNIDIILTEVELPSISGYALLTLVMEHDVCKNIPVIMMSSNDSISMVLKCMLKGAADFLVKPVRRNELRNLWQHVWRRHTLTAGHVPQNSPIEQCKVEATSENNSASNHSSDCATSSRKHKESNEIGSDTQGLSQLTGMSASNLSNTDEEKYSKSAKLDRISVTPESKTGERSSTMEREFAPPVYEAYYPTALRLEERACAKVVIQNECGRPVRWANADISHGPNHEPFEPSGGAIDLIGTFDNGKCTYKQPSSNDGTSKFEFNPQLELSLRRYPSTSKNQGFDEKHALNHSNASAFSWYNGKTLQPFFPTSTSYCTEFKDDESELPELSSNQLSQNTSGTSQRHGSTGSDNLETMTSLGIGQYTQAELAHPGPQLGMISASGTRLDNICAGYGQVHPPVYHAQAGLPPARSPKLTRQRENSSFPASTSVHSNAEIYDFEQKFRRSDEATNSAVDQDVYQKSIMEQVEEEREGSSAADKSNSSDVANHNNSSTYGSVCNGNAMATGSMKNGDLVIHDGFRGMDSHRCSQREAALTKFRLKRKDRCYEKKVRYQSRKKLAEQRPRVRGQFVRQVQNDASMIDANV